MLRRVLAVLSQTIPVPVPTTSTSPFVSLIGVTRVSYLLNFPSVGTEEVDEVGHDEHIIKGVYLAVPTAEDGLFSVVVDVDD